MPLTTNADALGAATRIIVVDIKRLGKEGILLIYSVPGSNRCSSRLFVSWELEQMELRARFVFVHVVYVWIITQMCTWYLHTMGLASAISPTSHPRHETKVAMSGTSCQSVHDLVSDRWDECVQIPTVLCTVWYGDTVWGVLLEPTKIPDLFFYVLRDTRDPS